MLCNYAYGKKTKTIHVFFLVRIRPSSVMRFFTDEPKFGHRPKSGAHVIFLTRNFAYSHVLDLVWTIKFDFFL